MTQTAAPASVLKPPLKWAGGKRWLLPHLAPLWEPYRDRRYVEPFCGGMAVPLGVLPERALLNDTNEHLIGFYRWLQDGLVIDPHDLDMRNDSAAYYHNRAAFNDLIRDGEAAGRRAAAHFYYLNRTGYNGLCRFNRKGQFNVPFGSYATINYRYEFMDYRVVLSGWTFTTGDFADMPLEDDDFIYADPPYDVEFTQYSRGGFTWDDQVRTAEWLAAHPGPVILSNQATERIVHLYKSLGFALQYKQAPRRISCNGDRTPALEVVALKGIPQA